MSPPWMRRVLLTAGVYNLLWGAAVIAMPGAVFDLAGMARPTYPMIWQCVGMVVGVYGVGYLAAARDPLRHWPITLVGLLGKVLGPIGVAWYVARGALPPAFALVVVFNDLVWWWPFGAILRAAWRAHHGAR